MGILYTNLYIFVMATVLAILEIQIEGRHGWAKKLPAWRPHASKWYVRLFHRLSGNKELTGYHAILITFLLLVFHLPFAFGLKFSAETWLKTLSFFFIFIALWDFLWFVLNPYYPLRQFKKEHIWWHKKWLLGLPLDYYVSVLLSFLVLLPAPNTTILFYWWIKNIALFLLEILIVTLFTLYVLNIDNWHAKKTKS